MITQAVYLLRLEALIRYPNLNRGDSCVLKNGMLSLWWLINRFERNVTSLMKNCNNMIENDRVEKVMDLEGVAKDSNVQVDLWLNVVEEAIVDFEEGVAVRRVVQAKAKGKVNIKVRERYCLSQ